MASRRKSRLGQKFKRPVLSRPIPARVLILTEGTETEPDYFRYLVGELGLPCVFCSHVMIETVSSGCVTVPFSERFS